MKFQKYIDGLYGIQSNLDLTELKKVSLEMYDVIKEITKDKLEMKNSINGVQTSTSETTKLFSEYNLLMYPFPVIHDLYCTISSAFHTCLEDYYGSKIYQKHFIQCWLNIFKKDEFIDWHKHQPSENKAWHGFICVDTEPDSLTTYSWPKDLSRKGLFLDVPSKNGLIVMGLSNDDRHKSSKWTIEERPRITIAFDIVPAIALSEYTISGYPEPRYLNAVKNSTNSQFVNHWIPI